ncbi:UNVERIFIED_CONTAM: hypothetical protein HDU68_007937 [Siphonaria sp. JEL0065]|nr:hypothetical protein HDU68_007937 [Siphonaria sp. JEL0065]
MVQGYLNKGKPGAKPPVQRRPRTQFDLFCISLGVAVAVCAGFGAYKSWTDSTNVLNQLGLTAEAPLSTLKHRLNLLKKQNGITGNDSQIDLLYSRLKTVEARRTYFQAGHTAFVACLWCDLENPTDFFLFSLPSILLEYIAVAIVVGVISSTERRSRWRLWGTVVLGVGGIAEGLCLLSPVSFLDSAVSPVETSIVRRLAFVLLGALMAWFDGSALITDDDKLVQLIEKQKLIFSRLQGSRLARSAILATSPLRKEYFKFHESNEAEVDALSKDEEYKTERVAILKAHNLSQMLQTSQMISGSIMQTAVTDGFLPCGIDPLPPTTVDDL